MTETALPIGEQLRGISEQLDKHFNSSIQEDERRTAYKYVENILDTLQEAEDGVWVAQAEQRFTEWTERVITPAKQVLGEGRGSVIDESGGVRLHIPCNIPLKRAESKVKVVLKFVPTPDALIHTYFDNYFAQRLTPSEGEHEKLYRPDSVDIRLAQNLGQTVLRGRNRRFGFAKPYINVPEIRDAAVERFRQVRQDTEFKAVAYEIHDAYDRGFKPLATGCVADPHADVRASYQRFDTVSPFDAYGIASEVVEQLQHKNQITAVAEGTIDKRVVQRLVRKVLNARAVEVKKQHEFTARVLEVITSSNLFRELAATEA